MRLGAILAVALALLLTRSTGHGQDASPSEHQVKAAFIFNFAKFIEWPPKAFSAPTDALRIGYVGDKAFGTELATFLGGKTVNNRALAATECRSPQDARGCHILFVSASESRQLPQLLEATQGSSVLIITETGPVMNQGAIINLFREGNKFRFEINDQAAKASGLKIASKLLELSRKPKA